MLCARLLLLFASPLKSTYREEKQNVLKYGFFVGFFGFWIVLFVFCFPVFLLVTCCTCRSGNMWSLWQVLPFKFQFLFHVLNGVEFGAWELGQYWWILTNFIFFKKIRIVGLLLVLCYHNYFPVFRSLQQALKMRCVLLLRQFRAVW